jgi:Tfp pilus assembly pilus retraction ATPase PilT
LAASRPTFLFFDLVSELTKRVCNGFGSRLLEGGYYGMVTFDQYLLNIVRVDKITIESAMTAASS